MDNSYGLNKTLCNGSASMVTPREDCKVAKLVVVSLLAYKKKKIGQVPPTPKALVWTVYFATY